MPALMRWTFQFVDKCHGIIFERDLAVSVCIDQKPVAAESVIARALARNELHRWR